MTTSSSIATQQAVTLDLFFDEELWSGVFDRFEVWRSRATEAGPYEPLTDDRWEPARVPDVPGDSSIVPGRELNLNGRHLLLRIGEQIDLNVPFIGTDPLTLAEAAEQITTASRGLLRSFVVAAGVLVVETRGAGLEAILRVVGGDAAPLLGLPLEEPASLGFGRYARVALLPGQERYAFTDPNGAASYSYRTRFFNSTNRTTSEFHPPFFAPPIERLSPAALVRGTVDLVDTSGTPVANRTVLLSQRLQGLPVERRVVVGGTSRQVTDTKGHTEFLLVRGASVTVSIAGTDLSRNIEVPTDPQIESFDMLDPQYGSDDLFAVQRPNLPFAARRAL